MALLDTAEPEGALLVPPLGAAAGSGRPSHSRGRRVALLAAAGAATAGLALLALLRSRRTPSAAGAGPAWAREVIGEADGKEMHEGANSRTCSNYPHLKFDKCTHNNLAGKGPDKGAEGMIFKATNQWTGHSFDLVLNAIDTYTPFSTRMNGMSGEYGTLNLESGSSVTVRFTIRHSETKEPTTEPYFALTFFDLDQGLGGKSQESVTLSNFRSYALSDDVTPGAGSEVRVTKNAADSRTFTSSTFGTGADNPKHPLELNQQQENRAVSVRFRNFQQSDVTFAASRGLEPRFFTFVAYPALICRERYAEGTKPQLDDLRYNERVDTPVVAERNDIFLEWHVGPGDTVEKGAKLCSTKREDGSVYFYRAPIAGKVKAIQAGLVKGDLLSQRLDDKTIVAIGRPALPALPVDPGDKPTVAKAGTRLKQFYIKEGDIVREGDKIADVEDENGQVITLTAGKDGRITGIQDSLKPGDSCDKVEDGNLATVGRLERLEVGSGQMATNAPPGSTFLRYLVKVGDPVGVNSPVAEVENSEGAVQKVESIFEGTVLTRQEGLQKGMRIDDAMPDHNIITVGKDNTTVEKLPPLEVPEGASAMAALPGTTFVGWRKEKGDIVSEGEPLFDVKNADGVVQTVTAARSGVVLARQDAVQEGDKIDAVTEDSNLLVVGRMEPLEVGAGEEAENAPNGTTFKAFHVQVGDVVKKGDVVATVQDSEGRIHNIVSNKYGKVTRLQEHLVAGCRVNEVMTDQDVLVVGKFPAVESGGFRKHSVNAPAEAIFDQWYVKDGQKVNAGDPIAQVTFPSAAAMAARRLQGISEVDETQGSGTIDIVAPVWGTVKDMQPLEPGSPIGDQQEGHNICTVDQGLPWWLSLLSMLLVLCCCLCCIHSVMKKPTPYKPMPPAPEPEPVEEEEPDGLRLDFQDGNHVRTVYAKRRPLGIKHNFKAPIVANDFTINSYAKQELGVMEGWKLRRIGNEELYDNPNFEEVNGKLTKYMKDFELWPLPIDFKPSHNSDEVTTVEFREKPIGIEFTNRAPIKVSKVHPGSPAEEAEVKEGWCVTRIGEADVTQNTNFREVIGYFNEGRLPLDDSGKTYEAPQ